MLDPDLKPYERKVTPLERMLRRSPYSVVTMMARIGGDVSETMLRDAVAKVQRRHVNLRVRIKEDQDHVPWFTSEGVGEIPVEVVPRESDEHWIEVQQEAAKVPFEFELRPAIRFILVQSPGVSEVIILCHHIICDGLSRRALEAVQRQVDNGDLSPRDSVLTVFNPCPFPRRGVVSCLVDMPQNMGYEAFSLVNPATGKKLRA